MSVEKKYRIGIIALSITLVIGSWLKLFTGEISISYEQLPLVFTPGTVPNIIIGQHRLPALLNAVFVGAGLSLSGYVMQVVFKNALAGPYILGVASGSGLLVAIFLMTGISGIFLLLGVSFFAVAGALSVSFLLLFLLAKIRQTATILIIGILISSVATAIISLLQYFSPDEQLKKYVLWTMGNLESTTWQQSVAVSLLVLLSFIAVVFSRKKVNLLLLPERKAFSLGLNVNATRIYLLVLVSVITGVSVAFCGPIGFVGIVVPHLSAMWVGSRLSQYNTALLFLIGGNLVLYADLTAHLPHTIMLPVNAILAVFGIPVIFYIILRKKAVVW